MEKEYTYYAFISYNHLDEKWAKSLQYKLHHYRLPSIARKEIGEDVKIRPVFRYVTNLSLGELRENLSSELEESKYLIVICSPNSAQPNIKSEHWVNDEVKRFISLGRKDRIIPVIVAGKPNSGDVATECFPPALRTAEIVGADLSSGSRAERRDSFLKIVAKLLDLKPDQLIRLTEREDRQRRIRRLFCFMPLLLLGLLGGVFVFDATRTVENYYADYVDSFGLPEGIFKLKKSELEHRQVHYRFEYRGFQIGKSPHADSADWYSWKLFGLRRKLVRVVQANSRGIPCKHYNDEYVARPALQSFEYDGGSRLREIRYGKFNACGLDLSLERRMELFSEGGVINGLLKFFSSGGQLGVAYEAVSTTKVGEDLSFKSEIAQHLVQRDERGRVAQRLFLNLSGVNVADGDGLYGFSYEYDDHGRQTAQWYLFRDGSGYVRRANKKGVAGCKYEYEGRNMCKVEYVDPKEGYIIGPHGWMVRKDEFDRFDNSTRYWFEDEDGKRTLCAEGYAEGRNEYDIHGNMTRRSYYGTDGMLVLHKFGFAEMLREYNERGDVTKWMYLGVDGKSTLHKNGYAEVRVEYDGRGNNTQESYFGIDGRPTLHKYGYAEVRREYNERGNVTRLSYYGKDGRPTLHKEGVVELRREYDERGNMTKESYYGVDGKPTLRKDGGFAELFIEYDERGNVTKKSYFGVDGKPITNENGVAERRLEYDTRGNPTKVSFLGVDGKPTRDKDGRAELRMEYDDQGNMVNISAYDLNGKLIVQEEEKEAGG